MGVEPFLLSSSLLGVVAQRLLRRLCPQCKEAYPASSVSGAPPGVELLYRPVGCPACTHTGYQGRAGIYELLEIDDATRRMIHDKASEAVLQAAACHSELAALRLLRDDGMRWVAAGETSLEELVRVTRD